MGGEREFADEKIVAEPELDSISGARGTMIVLDDSEATTRSPVPTTRRASASRGAKRPRRAATRNPARATRAASARAAGFPLGTSDQNCRATNSQGERRKRAFARGEQAQVPANDRTTYPAKASCGTETRPTARPQHATQLQRGALACRGRRPRNRRSSCSRADQRAAARRLSARIRWHRQVCCTAVGSSNRADRRTARQPLQHLLLSSKLLRNRARRGPARARLQHRRTHHNLHFPHFTPMTHRDFSLSTTAASALATHGAATALTP